MVTPKEKLINEALRIANKMLIESDNDSLPSGVDNIRKQIDIIKDYEPIIDGEYQCPNCWERHSLRSVLSTRPGTEDEDYWKCNTCGFDVTTPGI